MILCVFHLGFVTSFLSDTFISGYTTGTAILVLTSQIPDIFGLTLKRYYGPFNIIYVRIVSYPKFILCLNFNLLDIYWNSNKFKTNKFSYTVCFTFIDRYFNHRERISRAVVQKICEKDQNFSACSNPDSDRISCGKKRNIGKDLILSFLASDWLDHYWYIDFASVQFKSNV